MENCLLPFEFNRSVLVVAQGTERGLEVTGCLRIENSYRLVERFGCGRGLVRVDQIFLISRRKHLGGGYLSLIRRVGKGFLGSYEVREV